MIKDILKDKEPLVYQLLKTSLNNQKVAHSYLFSGEYNSLKIDTAILLAQSIIENKNDFACETCNTCKRIKDNNYFDFRYINGYQESIKTETIENMMEEFNRTALEMAGKKVYVLANVNNSSNKVLNMILKFLEEPSNEDTYAIFISDNKDNLLPTIVSRCLEIPFMTKDFSFLIKEYQKQGFDDTDSYLLSNILHEFNNELSLNDKYYLNAKDYVYKTIECLNNLDYLPILFSNEFYLLFKDRDDFKILSDYYLKIMLKMCTDSIENVCLNDEDYNKHLKLIKDFDDSKLLKIFLDANDKISTSVQRFLLFDAIAYNIMKVDR